MNRRGFIGGLLATPLAAKLPYENLITPGIYSHMTFSIKKVHVRATNRILKGTWSCEIIDITDYDALADEIIQNSA